MICVVICDFEDMVLGGEGLKSGEKVIDIHNDIEENPVARERIGECELL